MIKEKLAKKNRRISEMAELEILDDAMLLCRGYGLAIDGGANIGRWALIMARHFESVHAFEPVDFSFDEMNKYLSSDRYGYKVYPHKKALSDKCEVVHMAPPRKRSASTSYHIQATGQPVDAITIDSLGLKSCDLLKLDLEGAELKALNGAEETIKEHHPVIVVETIDAQLHRYGHTEGQLDRLLRRLGYIKRLSSWPNNVWIPLGG